MTKLLRHHVETLRLRPDAPWPSEQAQAHAEIAARRVESDPMKPTTHPAEPCPAFAPSTGQIMAFPVASCRNLSK